MNRLILSAAVPALLLAACAGGPATLQPVNLTEVPSVAPAAPPPHYPADLTPAGVRAADDHLALEEVNGAEAMAFVGQSNRLALASLEGDRRYETYRQQAEAILTATDRIPAPSFLGDGIGNFWQDAANPKGVWRRTTLASYRSANTRWETLLDIDALARAEGRDWVFKGANCLAPDEVRCLINLSDGGKDAVVVREFDTRTRSFVDGGFSLPEGKHRISWLDVDTLLVATDFGSGALTESGYPFIVKSLKRGQTLAQATEVYRGDIGDGGYGVSPSVYRDKDGAVEAVLFRRPLDTFRAETWRWVDGRAVKLNLPERVGINGTMGRQLVFSLDQEWAVPGGPLPAGALVIAGLDELALAEISRVPAVIFEPGARQSIDSVRVMSDSILAVVSDNVVGTLKRFSVTSDDPSRTEWRATDISVPANSAVGLGDSSKSRGEVFVSTQGFLTPPTLSLADIGAATITDLRSAPAKFDASTHVVEQFEATSSDGVKIPYFVTRPRDLAMDGSAPTILFGYGGFQVSFPPAYKPEMGKLWLENGGVFVQANIRGGGEFGPQWHQSVLNENRQLAFDDFAAVAADLHRRGISSPRRTGIYGRSNGGVLTSVVMTQHPELINAAVIESPLIDMLRYHELPAGASWIGEYGDPRIPEEAAWIARYSAYQQLRPDTEYPRVYITTNTRDDRVHPGHARKFAARLTDMGHDHLYYEETSGGHSNDADPVANARRWARHYVYLSQQLMD
ncbi:MAG: prolyl oligopeptidase family serine peptidase [Brevundimonas sp.]|uniref:prolyl oligopeptidase family serine peptidase n=1 Tax=Brevundimonas sp. TaxID=1871086 RepID=UPI00273562A2|nr:prolyl oligopeptidase family serine peptidase [Brevundimonas sp.]MDP3368730.1 prolyl oligopeptidase family serine peptidase [Brevundimonas sp.]MDP3656753.1 prolyl oligopeptidase family serine peptidase [Brevundimonas sp.]